MESELRHSLSEDALQESRLYGRWKLACSLCEILLDLVFYLLVVLWIATPLDVWLRDTRGVDATWLRLLCFYAIVYGLNILAASPLAWFSGHRLEHQFQLSRQTFSNWLRRYLLKSALLMFFGLLLSFGLLALIWTTGPSWWCWAAAAMFVVNVGLGQLAPVLILPMFYKIEPVNDVGLIDRFRTLADGTGLKIEGVYRMALSQETSKANAMLAGLGSTRRVILADTLMDEFSMDEIEVVLAHEIGHHVHRHIWKFLLLGLIQSLITFWVCSVALSLAGYALTQESPMEIAALPLITLVTTIMSLVLGPVQNAISRYFEVQCDTYALRRTGNAEAFRSAFERLAAQNKADPDPPFLEVLFFHDHPPISERLALADTVTEGR